MHHIDGSVSWFPRRYRIYLPWSCVSQQCHHQQSCSLTISPGSSSPNVRSILPEEVYLTSVSPLFSRHLRYCSGRLSILQAGVQCTAKSRHHATCSFRHPARCLGCGTGALARQRQPAGGDVGLQHTKDWAGPARLQTCPVI